MVLNEPVSSQKWYTGSETKFKMKTCLGGGKSMSARRFRQIPFALRLAVHEENILLESL